MATIDITNNTFLPIHAATEWNHIVQEYKNYIQPGETASIPAANFGWQDLLIVPGFKSTEISHDQDWSAALGFGTLLAGAVATIASIPLTIATWGGSTPILVASGSLFVAGLTTMTTDIVLTINDFKVRPVTVEGLWGPHGYTMTMTGGEVTGDFSKDKQQFTVKSIAPMNCHWVNKTTNKSGDVGVLG
jgi:hypothetical protein